MSQFAVSDPPKSPRNSGLLDRLADLWCRSMHDSPMLPIHGRYQCRRCHRYHEVSWEHRAAGDGPSDPTQSGSR